MRRAHHFVLSSTKEVNELLQIAGTVTAGKKPLHIFRLILIWDFHHDCLLWEKPYLQCAWSTLHNGEVGVDLWSLGNTHGDILTALYDRWGSYPVHSRYER